MKILKLRPHHLLCFHAFSGKGYNQRFIQNMTEIKAQFLSQSETQIELTVGLDCICHACPHLRDFGCVKNDDPYEEIKIKQLDRKILKLTGLEEGQIITARKAFELAEKNIDSEKLKTLCGNCEWLKTGNCLEKISTPFFSL